MKLWLEIQLISYRYSVIFSREVWDVYLAPLSSVEETNKIATNFILSYVLFEIPFKMFRTCTPFDSNLSIF